MGLISALGEDASVPPGRGRAMTDTGRVEGYRLAEGASARRTCAGRRGFAGWKRRSAAAPGGRVYFSPVSSRHRATAVPLRVPPLCQQRDQTALAARVTRGDLLKLHQVRPSRGRVVMRVRGAAHYHCRTASISRARPDQRCLRCKRTTAIAGRCPQMIASPHVRTLHTALNLARNPRPVRFNGHCPELAGALQHRAN